MKKRIAGLKSAISKFSGASADILLSEGDKICFGKHVIKLKNFFITVLSQCSSETRCKNVLVSFTFNFFFLFVIHAL